MGISRQAVYQHEQRCRQRQADLEPVREMVLEVRRYLPRLGTRKLYHLLKPRLQAAGIKLGRDGWFHYLRQHKMLIRPRRSYTRTPVSKKGLKKHPSLIKQRGSTEPEQGFVSVIT